MIGRIVRPADFERVLQPAAFAVPTSPFTT
jgi:hypothetical protein